MNPLSQIMPQEATVESAMKTISQLHLDGRMDEPTYTTLWNALECYRINGGKR